MHKAVEFEGDSREILRKFPDDVRRALGTALNDLQWGRMPIIAKHFGKGVWELRDDSSDSRTFRVAYILILKDRIHVLHAFEKRSQQTSRLDVAKIEARLKALKARLRR